MNDKKDQRPEISDAFSGYQRPNQAWVCGNTSRECDCPLGPLSGRKCGSRNEAKCKPRPSLRTWRKRFTAAVTIAVAGIVLIGFWQPWRADFLAPGPLSGSHAQLFQHETSDQNRCAACHEAGNNSPTDWLVDTLTGGNHIGVPQSTKCMDCHDDTLPADLAMSAHNVSETDLRTVQQTQMNADAKNPRIFRIADHLGDSIACSACHREHHGKDHELAALTDLQCQSCHQSQFESFADGHPEFDDWSTRVSLGIEFNHASHLQKHFPDKQTTFDCQQCHVSDARGDVQLLAGFESTCASCHEKSIEGNLSSGIQLVAIPIIDVDQLNDIGVSVGSWPAQATGDFDGKLPPMMKVLLAGDPRGNQALQTLGDDFDFYDLEIDQPDQVAAATELVWAIKRLINDMATSGEMGIRSRLAASLQETTRHGSAGKPVDEVDEAIVRLASKISIDAIQDLQANWFPNLIEDLKTQPASILRTAASSSRERQGASRRFVQGKPAASARPLTSQTKASEDSASGIQLVAMQQEASEGELLLENPLRSRYQSNMPQILPAGNGTDIVSQGSQNGATDNVRMPNHSMLPAIQQPAKETQQPALPPRKLAVPSDRGTILQENPLKHLAESGNDPLTGQTPDLSPVDQTPVEPSTIANQPDDSATTPQELTTPQEAVRNFIKEQMADTQSTGKKFYTPGDSKAGWIRNDELLTLTWQTSGHADPVAHAWLDTLVKSGIERNEQSVLATVAHSELNSASGTGYCLQCHGKSDVENR